MILGQPRDVPLRCPKFYACCLLRKISTARSLRLLAVSATSNARKRPHFDISAYNYALPKSATHSIIAQCGALCKPLFAIL